MGDGFRIIGDVDYGNFVTFMKRKNGEVAKTVSAKEEVWLKVRDEVSVGSSVHKTSDKTLENELSVYQKYGI